ncbi:MAG: hypothetical protein EOP84_30180, partial [Verrucomicrobiaceae bacterium]
YGSWLSGSLSVFGLARDDPSVLRASRAACADPQWKLIITHFCRPDVAAHLHGANSRQYQESLAWCDRALGELIQAAGKDTLIVVTSDHGVTSAGGHAGAEPDVLNTPLIASHPVFAQGLAGPILQTQIPHLLANALGTSLPLQRTTENTQLHYRMRGLLVTAATLLGGFALLSLVGSASRVPAPSHIAFWLNISVWTCLCAGWVNHWIASALALAALLTLGRTTKATLAGEYAIGIGAGILLGVIRILLPWLTKGDAAAQQPRLFLLITLCLIAVLTGYTIARLLLVSGRGNNFWLGAGLITIAPALSGLLGESVSLSTLDVRIAFRLIESPGGLGGAVFLGAIRPFLPLLCLLAGIVLHWHRSQEPVENLASFAAGAGVVLAGELAVAAITLAAASSHSLAALALGPDGRGH